MLLVSGRDVAIKPKCLLLLQIIKMLIAVYTTLLLQVQAIKMIFNVNGYEKVYQLNRKKTSYMYMLRP